MADSIEGRPCPGGLPCNIQEALQTVDPGGYKLYDEVVECILAAQPGVDPPVVRQILQVYCDRGLIEQRYTNNKHRRSYLRDATVTHPIRLTEEQYDQLMLIRQFLSTTEFRKLPIKKILAQRATYPTAPYHWARTLARLGFLVCEECRSVRFKLSFCRQAVVCQSSRFAGGRLVVFDDLPASTDENSENIMAETATTFIHTLEATLRWVEGKQAVAAQVDGLSQTLAKNGFPEEEVSRMLAPLADRYGSLQDPDSIGHDLNVLKVSLPVWTKYLREKNP